MGFCIHFFPFFLFVCLFVCGFDGKGGTRVRLSSGLRWDTRREQEAAFWILRDIGQMRHEWGAGLALRGRVIFLFLFTLLSCHESVLSF